MRESEAIPSDEDLFRAIRRDDVAGTLILPSVVDLQGTSVHRARFLGSPADTFAYVPDGFTGRAVLTSDDLPEPLPSPREKSIAWEFFAVDDPFQDERGVEHTAHPRSGSVGSRTDRTRRASAPEER